MKTKTKCFAAQFACASLLIASIVVPIAVTLPASIITALTLLSLSAVALLVADDIEKYKVGKSYSFSPLTHVGILIAALSLTVITFSALSSFILPVMALLAVVGCIMAGHTKDQNEISVKGIKHQFNELIHGAGYERDWPANFAKQCNDLMS